MNVPSDRYDAVFVVVVGVGSMACGAMYAAMSVGRYLIMRR